MAHSPQGRLIALMWECSVLACSARRWLSSLSNSHTVETPSTWVLLCDLEVKFDHAGMQTLLLQADDVRTPSVL